MTADQLAFGIDLPHRSVTDETAAILARVNGKWTNAHDRRCVVSAIVYVARRHLGRIDPNEVRGRLTDPVSGALTVKSQVLGSTYQTLATLRVIEADGWTVNKDKRGRNYGKPARMWRLHSAHIEAWSA